MEDEPIMINVIGLIGLGAIIFALLLLGHASGENACRKEAIEHGVGYYDPITREFKWKMTLESSAIEQ